MELLYHYLWKHRMAGKHLSACDGRTIDVISPGIHNEDAGPDFSNARIKIGDEDWTGNVEIHVKASDWYAHGHDKNPAYDNVILHVVALDDRRILRPDGKEIPQLVIVMPRNFYLTYSQLSAGLNGIRCAAALPGIPRLNREDWLETLAMERIHAKADRLLNWYAATDNDWEQTSFIALARGLGFNLNGVPFELLAKSLPLKYVYRHSDNPMQVEALLFGQAGMLDASCHIFDDYYQELCHEYAFLAAKYGLKPLRRDLWKYARTRPHNFPHRRIALLASALSAGKGFTSPMLDSGGDPDKLDELFSWGLHPYWHDHFAFGSDSLTVPSPASLSRASKELLMINVAAPFFYAYAKISGLYDLADHGADLLLSLRPERNAIVSRWEGAGIKADSALRSQAIIHLNNEYCGKGRCLECRFGNYLLRKEAAY